MPAGVAAARWLGGARMRSTALRGAPSGAATSRCVRHQRPGEQPRCVRAVAARCRTGAGVGPGTAPVSAGSAPGDIAQLADLASVVHVSMATPPATAFHRFCVRADTGTRHPSHPDHELIADIHAGRRSLDIYEVAIPYPTLRVDATGNWNPPLDEIVTFIESKVGA